MRLSDASNSNQPTRWKDFSLDYQLFFVYFGCMVLLFVSGDSLSLKQELIATIIVAAVLISVSVRNRQRMNWRWPGAGGKGVLAALGIVVVGAIFEFASSGSASPSDPRFLPWHLAGWAGVMFGVLTALRIVQPSKVNFQKQCGPAGDADFQVEETTRTVPVLPTDPLWKRAIRGSFYFLGFLVWLEGMASFYLFDVGKGTEHHDPKQLQAYCPLVVKE